MSNWTGIEEVVAIAETGSFVKAAEALGISTSHVSRAVVRLENNIGAPIFNRTTRRVVATPVGRALVEQFRRIINERDDALAAVSDAGLPRGEIKLTCSTAMGERFVAKIARDYASEHPDVSVRIELTNRVVDLFDEGFDLAIRTGTLPDSSLIATRIASRRLYLCAAPNYLAKRGMPWSIEDLDGHDHLMGTSSTWYFQQNGEAQLYQPTSRWRCNSGTAVANAALEGHGICQLPDFYVTPFLQSGDLVAALDDFQPPAEPVWAVYPQRRHLLPKIRLFVDKLRADLPRALASAGPR